MAQYIIKRLLLAVLILFFVSLIIYGLVRMLPNDYVDQKFQSQLEQGTVTQEYIDNMKALYGLDDNSFGGIIKGYFKWLSKALHGDLGISFKSMSRWRTSFPLICGFPSSFRLLH